MEIFYLNLLIGWKNIFKEAVMGKNHNADISNSNKGTKGTNVTYDKNQGNRGTQMNPNNKGNKK